MQNLKVNFENAFANSLERGTTHQEWCEEKYLHSDYIAEYYNTWTSLAFVIIAIAQFWLSCDFETTLPRTGIRVIWVLLLIVGVCSGIYHSTLSLAGQLLDEVSITWVVLSVYAFMYPKTSVLSFWPVYKRRWVWACFWLNIAISFTLIGWVWPAANAFLMMFFALPFIVIATKICYSSTCWKLKRLGLASVFWSVIGIILWAIDRLLCEELSTYLFEYENQYERQIQEYVQLHAAWHVIICVASYTGIVITQRHFVQDYEHLNPYLQYWPWRNVRGWEDTELGLPYIIFKKKKWVA